MNVRELSALLAILFYSALAQGQDKPPNATASARVHFTSGLEHAASGADLDSMILNYSILNGALELLPQTLASMAIIPLQVRMVYRIGKAHGFELDQGHIKDLLATLGVGLTSQYLEQFGRKLVGGLLGKIGGGFLGGVGSASTGAAFSFATTYALGHVANAPAIKVLRESLAGTPMKVRIAVAEGCVLCAERLLADGKASEAIELYDLVRKADLPKQKKLEGTRGAILARSDGTNAAITRPSTAATIRAIPTHTSADASKEPRSTSMSIMGMTTMSTAACTRKPARPSMAPCVTASAEATP